MCLSFHFMLSKATEWYKVNENLSLLIYFWPDSSYIFKVCVFACVYWNVSTMKDYSSIVWRMEVLVCSVHFPDWSLAGALPSQL